MEHKHNAEWVAERFAAAGVEWQPNAGWARARLRERMEERRGPGAWRTAALTAAAMLAVCLALPQGRVLAQELWYRWFLRSFDVVRVDLSRIPLAVSITSNGLEARVVSLEEVERRAGFRPVALGEGVAQWTVTGPIGVRQVVQVRALEEALARAGATGTAVPAEWQGVELRMDVAPLVIAEYGGGVQVIQSRPIGFQAPAGFPLARFAEVAFRCAGVAEWKARAMGEKFARNPAWLLDIPEDEVVTIEEVVLEGASGLLVDDPEEGGGRRVTILFGTAERIFAVSSGEREQSLRIANALLRMPPG